MRSEIYGMLSSRCGQGFETRTELLQQRKRTEACKATLFKTRYVVHHVTETPRRGVVYVLESASEHLRGRDDVSVDARRRIP